VARAVPSSLVCRLIDRGATEHGPPGPRAVSWVRSISQTLCLREWGAAAGGVLDPIEANSATTRARKLSCPRCACGGNGLWSMLTAARVVTTARGGGTTPGDSGVEFVEGLVGHRARWQADPHRRRVSAEERKRCGSTVVLWCRRTDGSAAAGSDAALLTAPVTRPRIATATIVTPSCRSWPS
jgi:hypothetical protein